MALRVYVGNAQVRAGGFIMASLAQRVWIENGASTNALEGFFPTQAAGIAREMRPNNDGPGWTKSIDPSAPDVQRPIPFKAAATRSLLFLAGTMKNLIRR